MSRFEPNAGPNATLKQCLIVQTGGTIDKVYPTKSGAYAFEIASSAAADLIKKFNADRDCRFHSIFKKDSQELTDNDRELLLKLCKEDSAKQIVITHGTDTIIETARYLSEGGIPKTVVLTGATQPACMRDTDAEFNVGFALAAAQLAGTGVYVAMNGRLIPVDAVVRNPETLEFEFGANLTNHAWRIRDMAKMRELEPMPAKNSWTFHKWTLVLAASAIYTTCAAISLTWHAFVEDIKQAFGVTYREASLLPTFMIASTYFSLPSVISFRKYGYRKTFCGVGLISSVLLLAASFAKQYMVFLLILGVVNGFVFSVAYNGPIIYLCHMSPKSTLHYFYTFASLLYTIGLLVMPFLVSYLKSVFCFRGSIQCLAGVVLQLCIFGAFLPDKKPPRKIDDEPSFGRKLHGIWKLIRNPKLIILHVVGLVESITFTMYLSFSTSIMIKDYSLSNSSATTLISTCVLLSIAGKIIGLGMKPDIPVPRWWVWCIALASQGLGVLLLGLLPSYGVVAAYISACLFWSMTGLIYVLHPIVIKEAMHDDFDEAYTLNLIVYMMATLTTPPIAGYFADQTGSFQIPLIFAGGLKLAVVFPGILWLPVTTLWKKCRRHHKDMLLQL